MYHRAGSASSAPALLLCRQTTTSATMDYKGLGLDAPTSAKYNGCIACQYAEGYTFALLATISSSLLAWIKPGTKGVQKTAESGKQIKTNRKPNKNRLTASMSRETLQCKAWRAWGHAAERTHSGPLEKRLHPHGRTGAGLLLPPQREGKEPFSYRIRETGL